MLLLQCKNKHQAVPYINNIIIIIPVKFCSLVLRAMLGQRNAHTGIICINLHEKIFFLDILHKITKVGTREIETKQKLRKNRTQTRKMKVLLASRKLFNFISVVLHHQAFVFHFLYTTFVIALPFFPLSLSLSLFCIYLCIFFVVLLLFVGGPTDRTHIQGQLFLYFYYLLLFTF